VSGVITLNDEPVDSRSHTNRVEVCLDCPATLVSFMILYLHMCIPEFCQLRSKDWASRETKDMWNCPKPHFRGVIEVSHNHVRRMPSNAGMS
jgi:hypothetical protein